MGLALELGHLQELGPKPSLWAQGEYRIVDDGTARSRFLRALYLNEVSNWPELRHRPD